MSLNKGDYINTRGKFDQLKAGDYLVCTYKVSTSNGIIFKIGDIYRVKEKIKWGRSSEAVGVKFHNIETSAGGYDTRGAALNGWLGMNFNFYKRGFYKKYKLEAKRLPA